MKENKKYKNLLFQVSAIAILVSAILVNFEVTATIAKWVIIAGATGYAATTFTSPYPGKSLRGKRLFNIQVFAALLFCVSAYLMYSEMKAWVVTMLVGAIFTLYCAIVLPIAYKNEQEEDKK